MGTPPKPLTKPLLYRPAGRAGEYAGLAVNLYRGCAHGCEYCYAPATIRMSRADFYADAAPRAGIIGQLRRELERGEAAGTLPAREPVLLSFTSDAYQPAEDGAGIAREAIGLLHAHGYPVHVLTKGGRRAARDFDILGELEGDAYAVSLTFLSAADSERWEPGAALPRERLATLAEAHACGIATWVSLEPVIAPAQTLALIREAAPIAGLFKVGKLNHHPLAALIDWPGFAREAVALLEELHAAYYLKADLREYVAA
jgi:DNA repair photolyase